VGRAAALLILLAALAVWFEIAPHLHPLSEWWSVAVISCVVMPAMFGLTWLALPLREHRRISVGGSLTCVALALLLGALDAPVFANFAKFGAVTLAGWVFLWAFESLSWVVLVACLIPWVDAYSVWHGPTRDITDNHPAVFTKLSIAFVVPGGNAARLGLPDVLFFAVFLGAAARWGLRPFLTWLLMVAGLVITITLTTFWATGGLPALPAIALGFLLANCDLLWTRLARPKLRALEQRH
jgi:hypothetical protein